MFSNSYRENNVLILDGISEHVANVWKKNAIIKKLFLDFSQSSQITEIAPYVSTYFLVTILTNVYTMISM